MDFRLFGHTRCSHISSELPFSRLAVVLPAPAHLHLWVCVGSGLVIINPLKISFAERNSSISPAQSPLARSLFFQEFIAEIGYSPHR